MRGRALVRAAILAALGLSGCASRGSVREVQSDISRVETEAISRSVQHTITLSDLSKIFSSQVEALRQRIEQLQGEMLGEWDRPECENYKPEAQRLFCKRKPRFMPYRDAVGSCRDEQGREWPINGECD